MSALSLSVSLLRHCLEAVRLLLSVLLGLFVLYQAGFLLVYNVCDGAEKARDELVKHRSAWIKSQENKELEPKEGNPKIWAAVTSLPLDIGPLLDEWAEEDKKSRLAQFKEKNIDGPLNRWARLTGQEQNWSLFAPNTVDWTCLISVELRWTDDPEPLEDRLEGKAVIALAGGTAMPLLDAPPAGAPDTLRLLSDNQPRDIASYVKIGHFRTRRFESNLETAMRKNSRDEKEEDYRHRWEQRVRDKVHGDTNRGEGEEIAIYLPWKLRKFLDQNPGVPEPKQVILYSRTWTIPAPPGERPWMWEEESDEPVCRWRPERHWPSADSLELYLHSEHRFENKKPTRWPLIPRPATPGSSD